MSAKLKIKRGSTASWADSTNKDTTLESGQLGVEYLTDGNMRLKVGSNEVELISSSTHSNGDEFNFEVVKNASYQFVFDGTPYERVCTGTTFIYVGNGKLISSSYDDTGEPFCIYNVNSGCRLVLSDTGSGHTIQLTKVKEDWSSLPYVTPSTSVYQDQMLTFKNPGGDSTFTIMGRFTGMCKLLHRSSETNSSSITLSVNSTASSTSGSVVLSSYSDDGAPSLNSSNTRLGCPNTPWIKGYITDIYTDSTTYSNSMKVAYNSETEALEFISL